MWSLASQMPQLPKNAASKLCLCLRLLWIPFSLLSIFCSPKLGGQESLLPWWALHRSLADFGPGDLGRRACDRMKIDQDLCARGTRTLGGREGLQSERSRPTRRLTRSLRHGIRNQLTWDGSRHSHVQYVGTTRVFFSYVCFWKFCIWSKVCWRQGLL